MQHDRGEIPRRVHVDIARLGPLKELWQRTGARVFEEPFYVQCITPYPNGPRCIGAKALGITAVDLHRLIQWALRQRIIKRVGGHQSLNGPFKWLMNNTQWDPQDMERVLPPSPRPIIAEALSPPEIVGQIVRPVVDHVSLQISSVRYPELHDGDGEILRRLWDGTKDAFEHRKHFCIVIKPDKPTTHVSVTAQDIGLREAAEAVEWISRMTSPGLQVLTHHMERGKHPRAKWSLNGPYCWGLDPRKLTIGGTSIVGFPGEGVARALVLAYPEDVMGRVSELAWRQLCRQMFGGNFGKKKLQSSRTMIPALDSAGTIAELWELAKVFHGTQRHLVCPNTLEWTPEFLRRAFQVELQAWESWAADLRMLMVDQPLFGSSHLQVLKYLGSLDPVVVAGDIPCNGSEVSIAMRVLHVLAAAGSPTVHKLDDYLLSWEAI